MQGGLIDLIHEHVLVIHFWMAIAKGRKGVLLYSWIAVNDGKGQRVQ